MQRSKRFLCGYVIVYLLCETSVEHPMSFVDASQKGEARIAEQKYKRKAMCIEPVNERSE